MIQSSGGEACGACARENPQGWKFCMHCGAAAAEGCKSCSAPLPGDAKFCPACGTSTQTETPAEMLKVVSVLFLDVVGSTAMTEAMYPEEARELMARFLKLMEEEVESAGGRVDRLLGDGLMAIFGLPAAHEDDAVRAVGAAKRMLSRTESWNQSSDHPIEIRIGINTGEVSTGGASAESLRVMGDPVNVASRLESAATPGTILIGELTARRVKHLYELAQHTLTVKGKSEEVQAFVVRDERQLPQPARPLSPLVGRDEELAWLVSGLDATERLQRPRVATLGGEPGVGKSRLLREFLDQAGAREIRIVAGRCLPYGEAMTLWPLGEVLKAEAGILATDDPDTVRSKVVELVGSTIGSGDEATVAAGLLATLGVEQTAGPRTDPRLVYNNLLRSWSLLLQAMAGTGSMVVLIEDIHWADPTMLDVIARLSEMIDAGVFFLCSSRPGESSLGESWWREIREYSTLMLEPLSAEGSIRLLGLLLDPVSVPDEVKRSLAERAGGNPFFLEEMIGRLADEGLLRWDGSSWVATGPISTVVLPERVQDAILARLDLLTPVERAAAQHAAVVGRTFWKGALASLVSDSDLWATLDSLQRRGLIKQQLTSSLEGEHEFAFKHGLITDVAAKTLPRKTRGTAHSRIAEWIDAKTSGRRLEYSELLAHHRHRAADLLNDQGLRAKARGHYLDAARVALGRFALKQAETFGVHALKMAEGSSEEAVALELLGDVHHFAHRGSQALEMYLAALDRLGSPDPSEAGSVTRLCARCAILCTRWEGTLESPLESEEVRRLIDKGLEAAGRGDGPDRALLLASRAFLQGQGYEERDEAGRAAADEALVIAERIGDPHLISAALDASAFWLFPDTRYGEIHEIQMRRAAIAPDIIDVRESSDALVSAAWSATMVGRYADAAPFAERGLKLARGVDPGQFLYGLSWHTLVRFTTGDWDGALADLAELESLESLDSDGLPIPFTAVAFAVGAFVSQLREDVATAGRYIDLMQEYRRRQESKGLSIGVSRMVMARCLAHRGEREEAERWLSLQRGTYLVSNLEGACEVADPLADPEGVRELIDRARAEAHRDRLEALPLFTDRLEARLALAEGDRASATMLLHRSADGFDRLGAPWEAARSWLLLGEILEPVDPVLEEAARALEVFERLGSHREAAAARALLSRSAATQAG